MSGFEIFAMCPPGLEPVLADEVRAADFRSVAEVAGGVTFAGAWPDVWRANIQLRGAGRILARIGTFRAFHLAQLDKRARKFDWAAVLRPDVPVRVDVVTKRSKIYHAGAAQQRIETAIAETLGAPIGGEDAVTLKVRIDDNLVTFSVDTSGESLHKRGHKEAVGKAPMRETLASLFLRQAGFDGAEPVLDPMCGSGTFVIEAAERAAGLMPGRARGFGFERLAGYDAEAVSWYRTAAMRPVAARYRGSDRDQGVIGMATANAERAGVAGFCDFACRPVAELTRPEGPSGLVMVNPPYGARIGDRKLLFGLYAKLGERLKAEFRGWRVGLVTSDGGLAKVTGLPFQPGAGTVPHGGLKVALYQTGAL